MVRQTFIPISVEDPRPEKHDFEKSKESLSLSLSLSCSATCSHSYSNYFPTKIHIFKEKCLRRSVWWICKRIPISGTQSLGFQTTTRPRLTHELSPLHSLQLQAPIWIGISSKTSSRSSLSFSASLYSLSHSPSL